MKRKRICIFVLILWALVHCTMLSVKIEQQMAIDVVVVKGTTSSMWDSDIKLPLTVLHEDADGPCIYDVVSGTGWEYGLQAKKSESGYSIEDDKVILSSPNEKNKYIEFASRPIEEGVMIDPVSQLPVSKDQYLFVDTESGRPQLITATGKKFFIESQMRNELEITDDGDLYCIRDIQLFSRMLPLLAILAVLMLIAVVLCVFSWFLAKKDTGNKLVLVNMGGVVIETGLFMLVLSKLDLPASFLPGYNIFNISHYIRRFTEVMGALEKLTEAIARDVLAAFRMHMLLSGGILLLGIVIVIVTVVVEKRIGRTQGKNEPLRI